MKKHTLLSVFLLFCVTAYGQVPEAFNYQAVIRDVAGDVISGTGVALRISIIQDTETGTVVYSEEHNPTTNDFGLVNLHIGEGTNTSGVFMPGGWGLHKHFIKVELDPAGGTSFIHLITSQLLSVPYSFHASTVEPGGGLWKPSGSSIYYNDGNIGIGKANPTAKLDILGSNPGISIKSNVNSTKSGNAYLILDKITTSKLAYVSFRNIGSTKFYTGLLANNNYRISTSTSTLNGIEVQSDGDVNISDELQTSTTGAANMIPIAYGTIRGNGTITAGSGNFTVERPFAGEYYITIAGEDFNVLDYIVTTSGTERGIIRASSVTGRLAIRTEDISFARLDMYAFSFVVYKP